MRLDDLPESSNIEDRRQEGGGGFGGGMGGRGGLGIGTVVVLGLIGWALGIDPRLLIGGAEILSGGDQPQMQPPSRPRTTGTPQDESRRFVSRVLGSTEVEWKDIFAKDGKTYRAPTLVMYSGRTDARCGAASSAMGPFYCPVDQKVYLDTAFFREIQTRFSGCDGKSCEFAQAYVIAHEVGHHVQNLLGILPRVNSSSRPRRARRRPTTCRSRSSCRPTVSPASGPTIRSSSGSSWSRATWRRRCAPRRRSATTPCRSRRRAMWCRIPSPTAPRRSASAGSTPASRAARWPAATPSRRPSFERNL